METLSVNSVYSLKPNSLVQKEHIYRIHKNTYRQRFTYIVIQERNESKNGRVTELILV